MELKAVFTIIALVENKIAPKRVMKKPAIVILLFWFVLSIIKRRRTTDLVPLFSTSQPSSAVYRVLSVIYTATLKSLNASFKLVLRSVLGLRFPIIKAQLTLYSPAGNFLV